jgi:hypothetical protein
MKTIPIGPVIIECITVLGLVCIIIISLHRYKKRKSIITLNLILAYLFNLVGSLTSFIGRTTVYIGEFHASNTHVTSLIGVIFNITAILFIISFTRMLFFKKNRFILHFVSLIVGVNVGNLLYLTIFYPFYEKGSHGENITVIGGVINFIVSIICYFIVFYYSIRESRKTEIILRKRTAEAIAMYGFLIALALLMLAFDSLTATEWGHYTVYYYIGWILFPIALLFSFVGYFQPSWFKRIFRRVDR